MRTRSIACAALVLLGGCYHATIETGARPGPEVYEKAFASSWIGGLVPPSAVSTAERCRSGVAKVETQLSFVNMLVGAITFGIYTPMHIKVTCAAGGSAMETDRTPVIRASGDTPEARTEAMAEAVRISRESGQAVLVAW